jgi:membrane-associated protease RseP (regulator of RpoE activity)
MFRRLLILSALLSPLASVHAQRGEPTTTNDEKGAFVGVLFASVSEALYDQLPQLPRNHGVLVTHVLPDSPAAKADVRKNDILLKYDDQKIQSCDNFAKLIRGTKPDHKVTLRLLRGGKEISVDVNVVLGPALKIAEGTSRSGAVDGSDVPKGLAKPNGPPPVSVSATPLDKGRMRVAIEYLPEGETRLSTLSCEGSATDIDSEMQKLPEPQRAQAREALQRIRNLISEKPDSKRGPG